MPPIRQCFQLSRTTEGQQKNLDGSVLLLSVVLPLKSGKPLAHIQHSLKSTEDSLLGCSRGFGVADRCCMDHLILLSAEEAPAACSCHWVFACSECLGKERDGMLEASMKKDH